MQLILLSLMFYSLSQQSNIQDMYMTKMGLQNYYIDFYESIESFYSYFYITQAFTQLTEKVKIYDPNDPTKYTLGSKVIRIIHPNGTTSYPVYESQARDIVPTEDIWSVEQLQMGLIKQRIVMSKENQECLKRNNDPNIKCYYYKYQDDTKYTETFGNGTMYYQKYRTQEENKIPVIEGQLQEYDGSGYVWLLPYIEGSKEQYWKFKDGFDLKMFDKQTRMKSRHLNYYDVTLEIFLVVFNTMEQTVTG